MNKKQKYVLYTGLTVIVLSLILWQVFGGDIYTKTQVLVETEDELFGTTKEFVDQFVWGLDLSALISGITVLVSGILLFLFRTKKTSGAS
jgi:hypothetical protein